jgi:hypothetical protein
MSIKIGKTFELDASTTCLYLKIGKRDWWFSRAD